MTKTAKTPKAEGGRQESKQKLYKIDVRQIVENHNPRDPLPPAVRQRSVADKHYSLFTGETVHVAGKEGEFDIKLDVWQLGTSADAQDRAKYCELMELDGDFVSWSATFLTVGQLEPVELRDNGNRSTDKGGNTYTTIFGMRRCLAILYNWCKLGGKGTPWVNAVLAPKANASDLLHRSITENLRKDPSPIEGARAVKMLLNQGQEIEDVARTYGKSESWVRSMLKLLELPAAVQKQIEERKITATKALEEAKPPSAPKAKPVSGKEWAARTGCLVEACEKAIAFLEALEPAINHLSAEEFESLLVALRDNVKVAKALGS